MTLAMASFIKYTAMYEHTKLHTHTPQCHCESSEPSTPCSTVLTCSSISIASCSALALSIDSLKWTSEEALAWAGGKACPSVVSGTSGCRAWGISGHVGHATAFHWHSGSGTAQFLWRARRHRHCPLWHWAVELVHCHSLLQPKHWDLLPRGMISGL